MKLYISYNNEFDNKNVHTRVRVKLEKQEQSEVSGMNIVFI